MLYRVETRARNEVDVQYPNPVEHASVAQLQLISSNLTENAMSNQPDCFGLGLKKKVHEIKLEV